MVVSDVEFLLPQEVVDNPDPLISNFTYGVNYNSEDDLCLCEGPCEPLEEDPRFCKDSETVESEVAGVTVSVHTCPNVLTSECTRDSDVTEGVDEMTLTIDLCDSLGDAFDCCNDEKSTTVYMVSRFFYN